jgi:hypothetical protein
MAKKSTGGLSNHPDREEMIELLSQNFRNLGNLVVDKCTALPLQDLP